VPRPDSGHGHANYKFYAFIRPETLRPGWDQLRIIRAINAEGIPCAMGSCSEIGREKAFASMGRDVDNPFPVARELGATSVMLQVHPTLNENDMKDAIDAVAKVMGAAAR
jgi:dTDP-4-amino-4,6-dideoxygalactose transaminase